MKKDFSQPFDKKPAYAHIIVQDSVSEKYALLRSREEWEKDFCGVFNLELTDGALVPQLTKYLFQRGFDLIHFRELSKETTVSYGFSDDTPGSVADTICILSYVNQTTHIKPIIDDQKLEWVGLGPLTIALQESPYINRVIELGLAQLHSDSYFCEAEQP